MNQLVLTLMVTLIVMCSKAFDSYDQKSVALHYYEQRNELLIEVLLNEGCSLPRKMKGSLKSLSAFEVKLSIERHFYEELSGKLLACRRFEL